MYSERFQTDDSTHLFGQGKILIRSGSAYCSSERSENDDCEPRVSPELRLVIIIELPYLERQHIGHVRAIKYDDEVRTLCFHLTPL